jgi:hypothetical protein
MKAWILKSDGLITLVVADYRETAVGLICEQIRGSNYADIDRLIGYVGEFENNSVVLNEFLPQAMPIPHRKYDKPILNKANKQH